MALRSTCYRCRPLVQFLRTQPATASSLPTNLTRSRPRFASSAVTSQAAATREAIFPPTPGPESSIPRSTQQPPTPVTVPESQSSTAPSVSPGSVSGKHHGKLTKTLAHDIQKAAPSIVMPYLAYGATKILYKECARQADYELTKKTRKDTSTPKTMEGEDIGTPIGDWYSEITLPSTFASWAGITILHMHLLFVRFRQFEPATCTAFQQHLTDHFFADADIRMEDKHKISLRAARNRFLKGLLEQYRGSQASYDQGLATDDAMLAAAVWRNIFSAKEDVDWSEIAAVVSYMRRVTQGLDTVDDGTIGKGAIRFVGLSKEKPIVAERSKGLDEPLDQN